MTTAVKSVKNEGIAAQSGKPSRTSWTRLAALNRTGLNHAFKPVGVFAFFEKSGFFAIDASKTTNIFSPFLSCCEYKYRNFYRSLIFFTHIPSSFLHS